MRTNFDWLMSVLGRCEIKQTVTNEQTNNQKQQAIKTNLRLLKTTAQKKTKCKQAAKKNKKNANHRNRQNKT